LPKEYHLGHKIFNRPEGEYREDDLEMYEGIHNGNSFCRNCFYIVLEVYQWLGNKYEREFVEMDLCRVLIARVCEIIDSILLSNDQRFLFLNSSSSGSAGATQA